jgi:hypothetical protein
MATLRLASSYAAAKDQAERDKKPGDTVITGVGLYSFVDFPTTYAGSNFSEVVIYSHGCPGTIVLGTGEAVGRDTLESYGFQGVQGFLAPNATVKIFGCSVAAQPRGERFLAYFAKTLLGKSGGKMTAYGGDIVTTENAVYHWDNTFSLPAVTAVVMPGGSVTLQNARYLDTKITQARLQKALKWMETEEKNPDGPRWSAGAADLATWVQTMKDAVDLAKKESLAQDPFSEMEEDWWMIRTIERLIRKGAPQYDPGIGPKS